MKKIALYILILIALTGIFVSVNTVNAQGLGTCSKPAHTNPDDCEADGGTWTPLGGSGSSTEYKFLAPLPNSSETFNTKDAGALGNYINLIINLVIGISAVLAVVMIVMGGIEYMGSELISSKEAGKERIQNAILGLLIALGAYALLNTINPDLLNSDINIPEANVVVSLEEQIKQRTGQGTCTPVTESSSPCTVANLSSAGFTNATQASSICNGESKGVPTALSGVDIGSDGNSFSVGLFQINILAHANEIKDSSGNLVCKGIFTVDPNPPGKVGTSQNDATLGGCLERRGTICLKYAAKVTNPTQYQICKNYMSNASNNIKYAAALQTSRNWNQWGANSSCRF